MWMIILLASLVGTNCKLDHKGYCLDKHVRYVLSAEKKIVNLSLYCRPGKVIDISLPAGDELADSPVIGKDDLFAHRLSEEPLSLQLWPTIPKVQGASPEQIIGIDTNVIVKLKSGIIIIMSLEFADFTNPKSPYTEKVTFSFPELEDKVNKTAQIREEERKKAKEELEDRFMELEEKASEVTKRLNSKGVMGGEKFFCTELSRFDRKMTSLLEIRAKRICQLGKDVYIKVELKNLARDNFMLKGMEIRTDADGEKQSLQSMSFWPEGVERPSLKYKDSVDGVIVFKMQDNTSAEYSIEVIEAGGKKRHVILDGVGF